VSVERRAGWAVVRLRGELDYRSCDELDDVLSGLVTEMAVPHVCVEVSALEFCDSSGVRSLVVGCRAARAQGGKLVVTGPGGFLAEKLNVMGLAAVVPVVDEVPG
jgi:anti-anti-sigma factor